MRNPDRLSYKRGNGQSNSAAPPADQAVRGRFGYVGKPVRDGLLGISPDATALPLCAVSARQRVTGAGAAGIGGGRQAAADDLSSADSLVLRGRSQVKKLTAEIHRKDEYLAILSHELRTPLCALGHAVALLGMQGTERGSQQPLQALIERQLLRMTQLVNEMCDVSRTANGLLKLQRERVDLRAVVINSIETLQSEIQTRNQHLSTHMADEPVWVRGDERRLEQVWVNLIANASKYTDDGGHLTVSMFAEEGAVVVRIADSGIGMSPESLAHIFELFRQANTADPRSGAGMGVGLALVRQLVELHGGAVTATSAGVGCGSEFKVTLPLHVASPPVTESVRLGEDSTRGSSSANCPPAWAQAG